MPRGQGESWGRLSLFQRTREDRAARLGTRAHLLGLVPFRVEDVVRAQPSLEELVMRGHTKRPSQCVGGAGWSSQRRQHEARNDDWV